MLGLFASTSIHTDPRLTVGGYISLYGAVRRWAYCSCNCLHKEEDEYNLLPFIVPTWNGEGDTKMVYSDQQIRRWFTFHQTFLSAKCLSCKWWDASCFKSKQPAPARSWGQQIKLRHKQKPRKTLKYLVLFQHWPTVTFCNVFSM